MLHDRKQLELGDIYSETFIDFENKSLQQVHIRIRYDIQVMR